MRSWISARTVTDYSGDVLFCMKSGGGAGFARRERLTGGLPVVGTEGLLHRNLIRTSCGAAIRAHRVLQTAFKAPSLRYQSPVRADFRKYQGNRAGWGLRDTGRAARPAAATRLPPS